MMPVRVCAARFLVRCARAPHPALSRSRGDLWSPLSRQAWRSHAGSKGGGANKHGAVREAAPMTGTRIARRFAALAAEGRAGLVTYIVAGDPDAATSLALLRGLPQAGADLIELRSEEHTS